MRIDNRFKWGLAFRWVMILAFILTPPSPASTNSFAGTGLDQDSGSTILLKFGSFNPLVGEPEVPAELTSQTGNTIRLIQVSGPLTSPEILSLEDAGATLLSYVPENTYLAHVPPQALSRLQALPVVLWVGHYHPAYKIQAGLLERNEAQVEINLLLFPQLAEEDDRTALGAEIASLGGQLTYQEELSHVLRATVPPAAVISLARLPQVHWIDRYDPPRKDMDQVREMIGATSVFTFGFDGTGITGAVKDAGIDQTHPDFGNLIGTQGNPGVDEHGTCTFGIVFADGTEDAQAMGMMPGGSGVFCDWGWGRIWSIQELFNSYGGVFQSNSWSQGPHDGDYTSYSNSNDGAINSYDVSMLYSAGNSPASVGAVTISQDSAAKNVICVGGVFHKGDANQDNDEWHSYFGVGITPSQGPAADGRIKPDLCGYVDLIYTTDIVGAGGYTSGNYVSDFGGTSGACPIVAGAAGLTYDMYLDNHFDNNTAGDTPLPATIKALLIANAHQYSLSGSFSATRYQQGWGAPDLDRIYQAGSNQVIVDGGTALSTGESWSTVVTRYSGSEPLKISLVWSDKAGEASASKALINDLDLIVTAPGGSTFYGNNGLIYNHFSLSGGSADRLNNVENVFIQSPAEGDYTIEVFAYDVALDNHPDAGVNQDFSLVASMALEGTSDTMHAVMACVPTSGTLPTTVQIQPQLCNDDWFTRKLAGHIDLTIASGATYNNWRAGYTNVSPGDCFSRPFNTYLPNLGTLKGNNVFVLVGEDITPPPYNQPPYSASGDSDSAAGTFTGY
jgi:serine protease AprX